ncbi:hypothetical protein SG34_025575 [Thalassomonas viridans]|uniref:Uncharacterized protein n=1 Tax=Thalassomonas viridans TaxID=137584 RepID=A0AAE9Z113_9GAMM|nr:hypothetical protein [Thalassomonas viridans]WDE04660.1 hypothetical protein SG34_025575 [Thalassomonas viridans]
MLPQFSEEKGMRIKSHYWLVHPQTGKKWTQESVAEFINSHKANEQAAKSENRLVAGVKKLATGIKAFKKS